MDTDCIIAEVRGMLRVIEDSASRLYLTRGVPKLILSGTQSFSVRFGMTRNSLKVREDSGRIVAIH